MVTNSWGDCEVLNIASSWALCWTSQTSGFELMMDFAQTIFLRSLARCLQFHWGLYLEPLRSAVTVAISLYVHDFMSKAVYTLCPLPTTDSTSRIVGECLNPLGLARRTTPISPRCAYTRQVTKDWQVCDVHILYTKWCCSWITP